VAMMGAAIAGIAKLRGVHSPEFWGAIGGVSPDSEHALLVSGVITPDQETFPTHINDGKHHGPDSNERLSQVMLAAAAICFLVLHKSDEQDS